MFYDQDKASAGRSLLLDIVDWSLLLIGLALIVAFAMLA
jgi:hypothetical protein